MAVLAKNGVRLVVFSQNKTMIMAEILFVFVDQCVALLVSTILGRCFSFLDTSKTPRKEEI